MHYGKQDEYRSERREVTISLTLLTSRRLNLTPMARAKVDAAALQQFLDAGHNQADAARHFGVSEAAVSQRVKQLRIATSKVVALERAADVVNHQLTAAQRLQHVQRVILGELTWAEQQAKQPGADRAALSDVIVKLSAEVRSQLRLEHDISRTLIDLRVVREFQRTVFDAISEESPETAQRIVAKLKEQQALRRSAELPTLDGGGGFDVA
jgi:DNA-binding transcriptional regulator YdaS (Cro superfamily)